MVSAQGGDISVLENHENFEQAEISYQVFSNSNGYIFSMDTEQCGVASMILGAGRETKDDDIDYSAGIVFNKTIGDIVNKGDLIATLYSSSNEKCVGAEKVLLNAITIKDMAPPESKIVYARVTREETTIY